MASQQKANFFTLKKLKKKSQTWLHYGQLMDTSMRLVDKQHYYCVHCFNTASEGEMDLTVVYKFKTTTAVTNLTNHIVKTHGIKITDGTIKNHLVIDKPVCIGYKQRKEMLTRDIALWFCQDLIAFEKVENKGFIEFLMKYKVVHDSSDVPCARSIANNGVNKIFTDINSRVEKMIVKENVSLAVDMWTDACRRMKYMGVTLHFIKSKELFRVNLGTVSFPETHSADNIYNKLTALCDTYGIKLKKCIIVRDCGANLVATCRQNDLISHSCIGHGIHNLISVDGFNKVTNIVTIFDKMKNIHSALRYKSADIASFNNNSLDSQASEISVENEEEQNEIFVFDYEDMVEEVEVEQDDIDILFSPLPRSQSTTIKSYCPTRWHSLLAMVKSMLINTSAINTLVAEIDRYDLVLSKKDCCLLTSLEQFLQQFKDAVDHLSADKNPTMNKALLLRCHLLSLLEKIEEEEMVEITSLKQVMLSKFEKRFPLTELLVVASILDPKFKELNIIHKYCLDNRTTRQELLKKYFNIFFGPINADVNMENSSQGILTQLAQKFSTPTEATTSFDLEIESYLLSKDSRDVLEFWDERKAAWMNLNKLAMVILAIPATSVPVERLFSIAGLTVNKKRSQLAPEKLSKILFIHDNYNLSI